MKPPVPRKGRIAVAAAMVLALALTALRCSVNVPLGVDPQSDAADNHADAGAEN